MHAIIQDCSIVIRNDQPCLQGEPDTVLQEVVDNITSDILGCH